MSGLANRRAAVVTGVASVVGIALCVVEFFYHGFGDRSVRVDLELNTLSLAMSMLWYRSFGAGEKPEQKK